MKKIYRLPFLCLGMCILVLLGGCGKKEQVNNKGADSKVNTEKEYSKTILVNPEEGAKEGKQYPTVAEAFTYVNENPPTKEKERIQILVEPGVYREFLTLTAPYVTLKGNGKNPEDTLLTFYYAAGRNYDSLSDTPGTSQTASTKIADSAHDFIGENISFENSYSLYVTEEEKTDYSENNEVTLEQRIQEVNHKKYKKQALALRTDADRSIFRNCRFIGRQDTLLIDNYARCYFEDCYIEGTTDFIFGSATAVFESCQINSPERSGYVTASSSEESCPYGYLFLNCRLTREPTELSLKDQIPEDEDYTLGRPWGALTQVIFWNCYMDKHIIAGKDRYVNMKSDFSRVDCRFMEGNTMDLDGNLQDMSTLLADYMIEITQEDIDGYYSPYNHLMARYNPSTKQRETPDYWNPGNYAETPAGTKIEKEPYTYPAPTKPTVAETAARNGNLH